MEYYAANFVLNPPDQEEVIKAFVFYSPLSPSVTLIAPDYVQAFLTVSRRLIR